MNKKRLNSILAIVFLISIALPFLLINSHHDCHYDECLRIWHDGRLGECVESTIDSIYFAISIIWALSAFGGLLIISKDKNAISPFVVMGLLITFTISLAFIDPSKWMFTASLVPSLVIFIILAIMDKKRKTRKLAPIFHFLPSGR